MTTNPMDDPARRAAERSKGDVIPKEDHAAREEADRAKAALDNVREGYEKAPPGAGGEPSWPTGGNISRNPKGMPDPKTSG